jgi:hypothetical protein
MNHRAIVFAALAALTASAQNTAINGGMQVGLGFPAGDFASKKESNLFVGANQGIGMHFGGHLDFNYNPNHELRLILNFNGFASKEQDIGFGTQQNSFSIAQLGADYVYNFSSYLKGGYIFGGLNFNRVYAKYELSTFGNADATQTGRVGLRIGGGYNFNRVFSLEGHFNNVSVQKDGDDGMGMDAISWAAVTCSFRFGGH